jgi:hypothetical protein
MRHSVKIEKSVTLGDRFFHLHLTLMQDTYNVIFDVHTVC